MNNISFINGFLGAFGVCPPCIDEDNAPNYLCDPCDSTVYSGGIAGWFAKKCNYEFVDITDSTEWETAIADKNVFGRVNGSRISGGLPAPEFTTKKRGSCGQEEVVKQSRVVSLTDAENDVTFTIDSLYNFLSNPAKAAGYEFGFVTCDGRFLGWYSNVTVRPFYQIAETDEDDAYWTVEFRYNEQLGTFSQLSLDFLLTLPYNVCWVTSIAVTGTGNVTTVVDGATLQMLAAVLPVNATDSTVTWSVVNGTGTATISVGGLLTATGAGLVTVIATANDASGVTGSLVITITP
jgi:Bacterial Ig-like domain (group 2)